MLLRERCHPIMAKIKRRVETERVAQDFRGTVIEYKKCSSISLAFLELNFRSYICFLDLRSSQGFWALRSPPDPLTIFLNATEGAMWTSSLIPRCSFMFDRTASSRVSYCRVVLLRIALLH